MKKQIFLGILTIIQGYNILMANDTKVEYLAEFRSTMAHCVYQVNGISVYSNTNRDETMQLSLTDRVGILLQEGKNSISIRGIDTPLDHTKSFCEMTLKAIVPNPTTQQVESKKVTSLRLTYDDNGQFTLKDSQIYSELSLTQLPTLTSLDKVTYYEDDGMHNDVLASRIFDINHPHSYFSWANKSTPIKDTPEYFEKVWQKYEEIRTDFANKNKKAIMASLEPGVSETEKYQGDLNNKSWINDIMSVYTEAWAAKDFKVLPVNKEDYKLQIGADGKLFRLVDKNSVDEMDSPIVYQKNGTERVINPTFTLINGKIVAAY